MDHIHLHHYDTIFCLHGEDEAPLDICDAVPARARNRRSRSRPALLKSQLYHVRKGLNCTGLQLRDFSATLVSP